MVLEVESFEWGVNELVCFLICYIFVAIITYYVTVKCGYASQPSLGEGRTLFVTAHPDDECMFFAPTILALTEENPVEVYLLCLSRGDYRNEGAVREKELWESCVRLGIPSENIALIHSTHFPDGPSSLWDSVRLSQILLSHVETLDISNVVTFDEDGVSGHVNHVALHNALVRLHTQLPSRCRAFALDSVNCLRKYSAFIDILPTFLFGRKIHLSSNSRRIKAVSAMCAHRSQMLWFRKLYIYASRYMLINTFSPVTEDFSLVPE